MRQRHNIKVLGKKSYNMTLSYRTPKGMFQRRYSLAEDIYEILAIVQCAMLFISEL